MRPLKENPDPLGWLYPVTAFIVSIAIILVAAAYDRQIAGGHVFRTYPWSRS